MTFMSGVRLPLTSATVEEFTPLTVAANENDVLAVVRIRATVRVNGNRVDMQLHHYFKFIDGKIAYYRGTEDTALTLAALSG